MLKWDEVDLAGFFGVEATFRDNAASHSFQVNRDGLRLPVTLFGLENAVFISIFRDGLAQPLFMVRREHYTHAHVTKDNDFRRCFEAGNVRQPVTNMGGGSSFGAGCPGLSGATLPSWID